MSLLHLLGGRDGRSQRLLEQFRLAIAGDESILWYPSAGRDFRDVIEMSPSRRALHGIGLNPNVVCHTDHVANVRPQSGLVYQDGRTRVHVLDACELQLRAGVQQPRTWPVAAKQTKYMGPHTPVSLLKVQVASSSLGTFERTVLYFVADNCAFLEQILVRYSLRLTHMVKVRQGVGFDNINPCLSESYPTAIGLGLRYLISDNQVRHQSRPIKPVKRSVTGAETGFRLSPLTDHFRWSGMACRAYLVEQIPYRLQTMDSLAVMLTTGSIELFSRCGALQPGQLRRIQAAAQKISIIFLHRIYTRVNASDTSSSPLHLRHPWDKLVLKKTGRSSALVSVCTPNQTRQRPVALRIDYPPFLKKISVSTTESSE